MNIPYWVTIPFEVDAANVVIILQKNLVELQSDEVAKARFKENNHSIWKNSDIARKCYCFSHTLHC